MNGRPNNSSGKTPQRRPGQKLNYVRRPGKSANAGIIIFIVLIFLILSVSLAFIISDHVADLQREQPGPGLTDTASDEQGPESGEENPGGTSPDGTFRYVEMPRSAVNEGDLILVNFDHAYVFPEKTELIKVSDFNKENIKASAYEPVLERRVIEELVSLSVELNSGTGEKNLAVNSGYRSYEDQQNVYASFVEEQGEEVARLYVATPGYSEHHTGLAADLTTIDDAGVKVPLTEIAAYGTLSDLLVSHGFILRYPENKQSVTKIASERWHYRYVGVPHSAIIAKTDLCLEEYIGFLKDFTAEGSALFLDRDGTLGTCSAKDAISSGEGYIVYYVPADGDVTRVPVPAATESYSISGNNEDGFIVTVRVGDPSAVIRSVSDDVAERVTAHTING